ncbi:unnamed protein product, partial [Scytosiphon promiscuus]
TELTISKSDAEGGAEVTLAPTLSFTSFAVLKAQIEALLLSLPGFEEEQKTWRLSSLQFCDDDCKLVALSASTFDPQEFQEPRLPRGQKVYLRARRSTPLPPHAATHGKKTMQAASGVERAPQRRALGRRDANALPVATTPAQTVATAAARDGRGGGTRKKTTRAGKAAVPAATSRAGSTAANKAPRPRPPAPALHKDRRGATTAAATPQQGRKLSPSSAPVNNAGSAGNCKTSRRERAPAYVFKASSTGDGNGGGRGEARPSSSKPPVLRSGGRQRSSAGGSGAVSAKKPGWNSGNEPMWEEAERKRAIMRKEARARILRKRATAAFKQALGGRAGGSGRGGSARVFRRGRRDCLVTDARRKRLGAYLFCDTIGALPSPLGKRKLDTYRELGRAAAAQMKYLAIADCDPEPKRGRGEGACGGDRAFVVFRRGDTTVSALSIPAPAAARVTGSRQAGACAAQKTVADKRIVVVASNASCSAAPVRKGGAAKAPPNLPAALRPPTARLGDIGFFRGGQGAAALTAAAAGKVRPRGCNTARERGGGVVAAKKEAAGLAGTGVLGCVRGSSLSRGGGRSCSDNTLGSSFKAGRYRQVALLKAAAGLSDEELTWRMETAKPEANAYRIASAALERAETTYERLLWRQGQLQIARARLTGRGVGGDAATATFATAVSRFLQAPPRREGGDCTALSRLGSASEGVRAAAGALAKLVAAVLSTSSTGSEVDHEAVRAEVAAEAQALGGRADEVGRDLAAVGRRVEAAGGVFYPSDLCVRLRECRPLHWLVSAPEDVAGANFLAGDGAAAFTQLEGMDLTEMRAVWSVLPREFSRDADGKKAEWRARFRVQLEGLARQRDGAVVTAGWDPVRGRRATARMPPLPAHRVRHPAYFYPAAEATASRVARLREQRRRLAARKDRLSALETELAEAKREAAKEAQSALARERKSLVAGVAEAEKMLSSTFPSLEQLESEAESIARIVGRATIAKANNGDCNSTDDSNAIASNKSIPVPGAFSEEPELRRRAAAAAKKLTPEEERRLRASEVQRAVSSRGDAVGVVPGDGGGSSGAVPEAGTSGVDAAAADDASAPAPRRPVKVAPGVLALLTKQHSARAAAAPSSGVSAPSRAADGSAVCVPTAPAPAKPMSKSLAALLARRAGNPPAGSAVVPSTNGEISGGDGGGGGASKKAGPSSLGFLGELKARAAAKNGGASAVVDRKGMAAPFAKGGGSFLEELKARTARMS